MQKKRQKGSALLVALIVMLVVTVIGLSLASSNRIDLLAAGAYQTRAQTEEYALSVVARELAAAAPVAARTTSYVDAGQSMSAQATTTPITITPPPGGGYSAGFTAFHYDVSVNAQGPLATEVEVAQGYYMIGPK